MTEQTPSAEDVEAVTEADVWPVHRALGDWMWKDADAPQLSQDAQWRIAEWIVRRDRGALASGVVVAARLLAEVEAERDRLRERIHTAVDECQKRHAPYVSRCAKFDLWSAWAAKHFERLDDNTWSHGSQANRDLILSLIEQREAAIAALAAERDGETMRGEAG